MYSGSPTRYFSDEITSWYLVYGQDYPLVAESYHDIGAV